MVTGAPFRAGKPVKVIVRAYQDVEARKRRILRHADEVRHRLSDACLMLAKVLADEAFVRVLCEEDLSTMPQRIDRRVRTQGDG